MGLGLKERAILHLPIHGHGENMARNASKAPLIPATNTLHMAEYNFVQKGYYRCSSSKGCPARKQVERSRVEPTMLVVTYSYEHNHPWPASRNNHHHRNSNVNSASASDKLNIKSEPDIQTETEPYSKEKAVGLSDDSLITTADEFGWFGEMELAGTISSVVWESRMYTGDDTGVGSVFLPMREEDESLFADLGELPECSVVFRRGLMEREEERRWWCGTTSRGAGLFGTFLEERD